MGIVCKPAVCGACPCVSCCGFDRPYKREQTSHLASWMGTICRLNPQIPFSEIVSLAAHHSATYSISQNRCCSSVSVCHKVDVYEQLRCGVRCLDFRYSTCDAQCGHIVIRHGPHVGGSYFDELDKVVAFLKENPDEFVIIDMDREHGTKTTDAQLDFMLEQIDARLGQLMVTQADMDFWFKPATLKLCELVARKDKRLLLLVDHHLYNRKLSHHGSKGIEVFFRKAFIESKWNDTSSPVDLQKKIEAFHRCRVNDRSRIRITSYTLTPQTDCKGLCRLLCCIDSLRVDNNMYRLFKNRFLQKLVRSHLDQFDTIQFVMTDMVSLDLHLLTYVVGLNAAAKLQVHNAVAIGAGAPRDLTQRLAGLVCKKGNSLWVIDAKEDLGLAGLVSLLVHYSLGEDHYFEAVAFDSSCQLVLNCFTATSAKLLSQASGNYYVKEMTNPHFEAFIKKCLNFERGLRERREKDASEI